MKQCFIPVLLLLVFSGCPHKNMMLSEIQPFRPPAMVDVVEKPQPQDSVFTTVEQMPSFPGGEGELMRFIGENLKYPAMAEELGIQGRITVRFIVSKTGDLRDIQAIRGEGVLDDSLISVVKRMPRWIPGKQDGKAVDVYFTFHLHVSPSRR